MTTIAAEEAGTAHDGSGSFFAPRGTSRRRIYYRILQFIAQSLFTFYFRGRVFGVRRVPRTGPVLLACNHQSFFDPVSVTLPLPREGNYMARDTLFVQPMFRQLIESLNAFPVKRGAADVGAVKEIMRRLRDGKLVVVFPEATRTRDGTIGQVNANSLLIGKKTNAVIVPTVIDGAFEAWPRTQVLPSPGAMYITYCEPISLEEVREWPIERIAETVQQRLAEGLQRSRTMRGQTPRGER